MLPYKSLIEPDRKSSVPLYIQICQKFIALIANGTLQPGDALPSSRKLSELIGINRNTIKLAYDELNSQGWAESAGTIGIFVLATLPVVEKKLTKTFAEKAVAENPFIWTNHFKNAVPAQNLQKSVLAIDDGFPDVRLAPVDTLMQEYRSISKRFYGKNFLKYGNPKGSEHLRISIENYLSTTRGFKVSSENIMITKGSQMGIYIAARLLLEPTDTIAVGYSNYASADATFKLTGASLLRIPVDEFGMDTDFLEQVLRQKIIKAVYVIPHHHCPTTVTMSMERRLKLLSLARDYRFAIIEDDYDFDFHYENKPYLPLASIDQNQNVIYIGSLSKTFAPALRIGFMTGPENFISAAASLRKLMERQGDTLMEEAFATLFDNGEMNRHFRKSIKIYKERRNAFCEILKQDFSNHIEFKVPEGGLAVWSNFDAKIDLVRLSEKAAANGLHISNGNFYKNEVFSVNGLRLGFASVIETEMLKAFEILKKTIGQ